MSDYLFTNMRRSTLTLCLVIEPHAERSVLKELLFAAKELGVELDFTPILQRIKQATMLTLKNTFKSIVW